MRPSTPPRHQPVRAAVVSGYALATTAGLFLLKGNSSTVLLAAAWTVGAALFAVLLRELGARRTSALAMLFTVVCQIGVIRDADTARDLLTLRQRGTEITATVVSERRDPEQGRSTRYYHYVLHRLDGTRVLGPDPTSTDDLYDVGHTVTVIEDTEGELAPLTPDQADATSNMLAALAWGLAMIGLIAWTAWRHSDAARHGRFADLLEPAPDASRTSAAPVDPPDAPHRPQDTVG
ncbi:hypothetical protein ACIO3O_09685 [Streptomyces sp. NPDC087440]|uniref:hypothetical protein n=1 Tax=Streptomyces sp. NPDC087440 TaxID=3365790 RepID=UPI0038135BF1